VTAHPYAAWAAQQIVEAVGPDANVVRLIRDRDGIYGRAFDARVRNLGIEQLRIAPKSPWQNGYAERFVGTLRRELLDHVIVLGERHLLHLVRRYASFYNQDRPHMTLDRDAPVTRVVEPRENGKSSLFRGSASCTIATFGGRREDAPAVARKCFSPRQVLKVVCTPPKVVLRRRKLASSFQ
jgi:Integrase core domain